MMSKTKPSTNVTRTVLRQAAPIMPVLTIDAVQRGVQLAGALRAAGMRVLEITLRTPVALAAIRAMRDAYPDLLIGAGTVVDCDTLDRALAAGAQFAVSPGFTESLAAKAAATNLPLLPGVMTPSEMMLALERGHDTLKLFPAIPIGGAALLRAIKGPFPQLLFCPTGGVNRDNCLELLALDNVGCVGGSWFIDEAAIRRDDWHSVETAAREALDRVRTDSRLSARFGESKP